MRDDSQVYEAYDDIGTRGVGRLSAAAAAVASLVVLGLVVAWTYRLGVRDASDVPVIRAVEGPAKIRPEDPGGARFAHQGRSVYGLMEGAPTPERPVTLAPPAETPVAEDVEVARSAATGREQEAVDAPSAEEPSALASLGAEIDQLVASVTGGAAPDAGRAEAPQGAPSPRPRPASFDVAGASPAAQAAAMTAPAAPPAAAPADGSADGPMVQLGAYLTGEDARGRWPGIVRRSDGLLAGRGPVVSPVAGATRTLHRLRAGPFASDAEAREMCEALKARGLDCIVPPR
ncbi:SPOR domain-containing protein [Rubrimonas cliftonensis]|uniref:Sporulation related domain-containing protein n=1 Tax=Rubrimonas cliftonensis TaxID=89524 RepID=A0A1H3VSD4_9RHOB|nr:SPOR domain-containing protein [Rubrimonas cliftonensis]SDZ77670.1 Sporulation related domain-containing protein [Rubrimonas cliftonensis]